MVVIVVGVRRDGDLLMVRYARRQMDRRRGRGGRRRRSFTLLAFDAIVIDDDVVAAYRRGTLLNRRCRSPTGRSFGSCILGYGTHRAYDRSSFIHRSNSPVSPEEKTSIRIRLRLAARPHPDRARLHARAWVRVPRSTCDHEAREILFDYYETPARTRPRRRWRKFGVLLRKLDDSKKLSCRKKREKGKVT